MSNYQSLKALDKRQAILDYLNAHTEGVAFAEIKAALGAGDSLSTTLNTMLLRDEIGQKERRGNVVKWIALVAKTKPVRMGPEPAKAKENAKKKGAQVTQYDGLLPYQIQPIAHTVKGRHVFLLDQYGHSSGGQAVQGYGSIQCNFSERSLRI